VPSVSPLMNSTPSSSSVSINAAKVVICTH
jgi:hypothetical protein